MIAAVPEPTVAQKLGTATLPVDVVYVVGVERIRLQTMLLPAKLTAATVY